jgi:HEPN domain-containing protein
MFGIDDREMLLTSSRELIAEIKREEQEISRHRARQIRLLRELLGRYWSQPAPSAAQLGADLDVSAETARSLIETANRTPELSDRMANLETGKWTFDRAAALARLFGEGADEPTMEAAAARDIPGIHKLRAMTKRIRRRDERQAHEERHVRSWPSLDESVGFINAQLGGYEWQIVNRALDERADQFPADARFWSRDQRRADALVAIAQDWLEGGVRPGTSSGPVITVMVDAVEAAATDCEAGVALTAGPRIGPDTLDRILCEGSVEIIIDAGSGRPLAVGPTTRVVPPKVRRFVVNRDGGCTIDGCGSRYRLEVHHIVPRSDGGTHDLENLTTLCWWHHQVAIHGRGHRIDPTSPPNRRGILPPSQQPP